MLYTFESVSSDALQLPHCHSVFSIKYYVSICEMEWQLYFRAASTVSQLRSLHMLACIFGVKITRINFKFLSELFLSLYPTTVVQHICLWHYNTFVEKYVLRKQTVVLWCQKLVCSSYKLFTIFRMQRRVQCLLLCSSHRELKSFTCITRWYQFDVTITCIPYICTDVQCTHMKHTSSEWCVTL